MSLMENESFSLKRFAIGGYIQGHYVKGGDTIYPDVMGNIMPMTGNELLQLPEGDRERDVQKVFTTTLIQNDDIITRSTNVKYKVTKTLDRSANDPPHYQAVLIALKNQ